MEKINFSSLGIAAADEKTETIEFNGIKIDVKKHLPIGKRMTMIYQAINDSYIEERHTYNKSLADMILWLYIVYSYTNIEFSDEDRKDETVLYDMLETSGLLQMILEAIDPEEYTWISETEDDLIMSFENDVQSIAYALNEFINQLPDTTKEMVDALNDITPEKMSQIKETLGYADDYGMNRTGQN